MFIHTNVRLPKMSKGLRKQLTKTGWLLSGMAVLYLIGKAADRSIAKNLDTIRGM